MLTKLDRLQGYSARKTCVALLSMLAIPLFASATAIAQNSIVSQQFWGANETNSAAIFENTTVSTVGGNWGPASPGGHSAAVNTFGVFVAGTSYGGFAEQFTSQNTLMTVIGESNIAPGGMAIDRNNYLYISGESSNIIYKIPVNVTANGVYGVGTYGPINSSLSRSRQPIAYLWPAPPARLARLHRPALALASCLTPRESARSTSATGNFGFNVASHCGRQSAQLVFHHRRKCRFRHPKRSVFGFRVQHGLPLSNGRREACAGPDLR